MNKYSMAYITFFVFFLLFMGDKLLNNSEKIVIINLLR